MQASISVKPYHHDCQHRKTRSSPAARPCVSPSNAAPPATCRQSTSQADPVNQEAANFDLIDRTAIRCGHRSHTWWAASPPLMGVPSDSVAAAAIMMAWTGPAAAAAEDLVTYDNAAGFGNVQNVFGVGYAMLVAVFAWRLLSRRIKRAKSEVRWGHIKCFQHYERVRMAWSQRRFNLLVMIFCPRRLLDETSN